MMNKQREEEKNFKRFAEKKRFVERNLSNNSIVPEQLKNILTDDFKTT
jgi:hypothetical protein